MTGTTRSSEGLDARRRRVLFRAWHRGIREMDLILGRFADVWIDRLTDGDLTTFEALLEAPDPDAYAWVTGAAPLPAAHDTPLFAKLRQFHAEHPLIND